MKKIYLATAAVLLSVTSLAQNLNPEVEVTNEYEARISEMRKEVLPMLVPDSLTRFGTKVDYSVFETRYMGAYDFTPYEITVTPEARAWDGKRLYARVGAGYPFHPLAKLYYSPRIEGALRNVNRLGFQGYGGTYHTVLGGAAYQGFDYNPSAGVDIKWNGSNSAVGFELGYNGILTSDYEAQYFFHDFSLNGEVKSTGEARVPYVFKVGAAYAIDNLYGAVPATLNETSYVVDGSIAPKLAVGSAAIVFDLHSQGSFYSQFFGPVLVNSITPKARLTILDGLRLDLGVKVSYGDSFGVFPDVLAVIMSDGKSPDVYASFTGGHNAMDYSALKTANHWVNATYFPATPAASVNWIRVSSEKLNARIGIRGSLAGRMQYDLSGGWASFEDAIMDELVPASLTGGAYPSMRFNYADYNMAYAALKLSWASERVNVDGNFLYRHTNLEPNDVFLGIPAVAGELSVVYNWNHRLFAGVRAKGQTGRPSLVWDDPGYIDLGLIAEYEFARGVSFWVQGGNLLNMDIPLSPTHVPAGINITAGICLEL